MQITTPQLGEGIESGTVVAISVGPGDVVEKGQTLLEMETDKAVLELPSPVSGKITGVLVQLNDVIHVDQPIFEYEEVAPSTRQNQPVEETKQSAEQTVSEKSPKSESSHKEPDHEPEKAVSEASSEVKKAPVSVEKPASTSATPSASPSVRRLAVELGVELSSVKGSGRHGVITESDVRGAGGAGNSNKVQSSGERDEFGPVERKPANTIRRITWENVERAWREIPHVTGFDEGDVTALEDFRKTLNNTGKKVTMTSFLVRTTAIALKKFPVINSGPDSENKVIIYKNYYNIGVAVDTPHGLVVPVIRNADRKGVLEIAEELEELSYRARERKLKVDEMQGGSFTISNLGGLGGTGFTPIIRQPEAAILGVSRARKTLVLKNGIPEERKMLPLSLSYDHRVIDGADATRFLRWLCEALEQPFMLEL